MTAPSVSVVVPVYGDGPGLDGCVAALLGQEGMSDGVELIVVDNGSDPPVSDRWAGRVRLITETSPGSYAARDRGVRSSSSDVLAFTDADCVPSPGWLSAGLAALEQAAPPAIVTGRLRLTMTDRPSVAECFEARYAFPQDAYLAEGFGVTANLFVPRHVYDEVGGFDVSLRSGGDRDFCLRARSVGVRLTLSEEAYVDHPARASVGELIHKARRTAGGNVQRELQTDRAAAVARRSLVLLRPPARAIRRILSGEGPLPQRIALAALVVVQRWVVLIERLRVVVSRRPIR